MTWLQKLIGIAASAELVVAVVAFAMGGPMGLAAAVLGSAVALGAQLIAILVLRPGMKAPGMEFVKRWTGGIAARAMSFAVIAVLIVMLKDTLPPIWIAAGYLVEMLTLLFAETVFLK